jgi:hypothetical protein
MRTSLCLGLVLAASCANFPSTQQDAGDNTPVDPCNPQPTNWTSGEAQQLLPGEWNTNSYCRLPGKSRLFFTVPGTLPAGSRWRLEVDYLRGGQAEDLDWRIGALNGAGDGVSFTPVAGSCAQPAGQNENCVVQLPDSETNGVWAVGYAATDTVEGEAFRIKMTRQPDPDAGM